MRWILWVLGALACGDTRGAVTPVHVAPGTSDAAALPLPSKPPRETLSANGRTTCLVRDGHVHCFGDPLGASIYGHNTASAEAKVVTKIDDAISIAIGQATACVLRRAGTIACWGVVDDGTRGAPGPRGGYVAHTIDVPEAIPDFAPDEIAVGSGFGCGIRGGAVRCWGMNETGVLGGGPGSLSPVTIEGIDDAVHVAAGVSHACVLRRDRTVTCWGGMNSDVHRPSSESPPKPVLKSRFADVVSIAMNGFRLCAAMKSGEVTCLMLQYENASTMKLDAVDVAASERFVCALRATGKVVCHGTNAHGELGDGGDLDSRERLGEVKGIDDAVALAAGNEHACALSRSGALRCWGHNEAAQAGVAPRVVIPAPTTVPDIADAVSVAVTNTTACALRRTGHVSCWGSAFDHARGETKADGPAPAEIDGVTDATAITGGGSHFCVSKRGGKVACWGRNGPAHCDDTMISCAVPTDVGIDDAIDVSAFREMTCAVRRAGTVYCWGGNGFGRAIDEAITKTKVPTKIEGITDAARVFVGYMRTCVVRKNGSAACFGDDMEFAVMRSAKPPSRLPTKLPIFAEIKDARDFVQIGRGQPDHVLLSSGEVRAFDWGNSYVRDAPVPTIQPPLAPVILGDVVQLVQGFYNACARTRSGEIDCWTSSKKPTQAGVTDATYLAMAESDVHCAVRANGTVVCWGENEEGQCGVDSHAIVTTPTVIHGLD